VQHERDIEQTLRVIRRLMERGERYEAITGRGALLSGLAALAVAAAVHFAGRANVPGAQWGSDPYVFIGAWTALAVACAASVGFTALRGSWRARGEGDEDDPGRRVSAQARAVIRAVAPAYLLATVSTAVLACVAPVTGEMILPAIWTSLHGVAILATSYHAPRRLIGLGWTFLVVGCAQLVAMFAGQYPRWVHPNLAMALGFGGLHLAYGLLCLLRPLREDE
jgi:hypothetical protein